MFHTWRMGLGCAALAGSMLTRSSVAHAVPEFPRAIERNLSLEYEPPCYLCHVKDKTGLGTAESPFALSMRSLGLSADNEGSITAALAQLTSEKIDSDGDGVDDVDELKAGTDPNTDAPVELKNATEPNLGCSALPHMKSEASFLPWLGIGMLFWLARRRQRR